MSKSPPKDTGTLVCTSEPIKVNKSSSKRSVKSGQRNQELDGLAWASIALYEPHTAIIQCLHL